MPSVPKEESVAGTPFFAQSKEDSAVAAAGAEFCHNQSRSQLSEPLRPSEA